MPTMKLPLGQAVRYRGMTGRDEDILANDKKRRSGEAIDEILANCVTAFGTLTPDGGFEATKEVVQTGDVKRLRTPDRMALLLAIRKASYGSSMDVEMDCQNDACGSKFNINIDLDEAVKDVPVPEDYDPENGFEVTIGEGDEATVVRFNYMTGHHEKTLSKHRDNVITAAMRARIQEVEGIHKNDIRNWLLDLPVLQRRVLRDKMAEVDAGPDMGLTGDCPYCGFEHQFSAHAAPGFFFPEG